MWCYFKKSNMKNKIKPIELVDKFKDINFNYIIDEYFKFNNIIVDTKFDYINNKLCILLDFKYKYNTRKTILFNNNTYTYYQYIRNCFITYYNQHISLSDIIKHTKFIFL